MGACMEWNLFFFANSALLGVGLAMDAFSVSLANGLNEPCMKKLRMSFIAGTYGFFQFTMPMLGWLCVHTIVEHFTKFDAFLPWISLVLLAFIGGKMIWEAIKDKDKTDENEDTRLSFRTLVFQGVATSIDALSVGFTTADYGFLMAFVSSLIICAVTFVLCMIALSIGKKAGVYLKEKASIIGGIILICIGIEIFVKGIFF